MSPARAGTSAVVAVLGAAGLLLVLVTWAASIGPDRVLSGGHVSSARSADPSPAATPSGLHHRRPARPAHHRAAEPPAWLRPVAFALELLTGAVVLFLAGRLLRRLRQAWLARRRRLRRLRPAEVEFEVLGSAAHVAAVLAEDADEQRALLSVVGEPRNAIVECWQRFEQQAVRAGAHRRPWQTTAEFVLEVLDLVGADRGAVARLADLYREARFSDHSMTDEDRGAALTALDEIHASLRSGVRV
jgi:Domain of unknown function (DUF4129)